MKINSPIIWIAAASLLAIALLWWVLQPDRQTHSWTETYEAEDREPYGGYIVRDLVEHWYTGATSEQVTTSPFDRLVYEVYENNLYILVNTDLSMLTDMDLRELREFAYMGNHVLLAARTLDEDQFPVINSVASEFFQPGDAEDTFTVELRDTLMLHLPDIDPDIQVVLDQERLFMDADTGTVLMTAGDHVPVAVRFQLGAGTITLSSLPELFSNYYILQPRYEHLLSALMPDTAVTHIYWDEYYKVRAINRRMIQEVQQESRRSGFFAYVWARPALRWAFWLCILLMAVYVLSEHRRRQRVIPVIPPVSNTSLAFAETIARLYLVRKEHRSIADKRIKTLLDFIRTQYYLRADTFHAAFFQALAAKSEVPLEDITLLFRQIELTRRSGLITESELIELNRHIEMFYYRSARNRTSHPYFSPEQSV
ncbi:MAG: DUF4350 domain-containing protein [Bacteroidia bacterium]|nr:DUF4350 domain-containing protein [Bacteroidia bacterium]